MWHTSQGDRTLVGTEAALIQAAMIDAVEEIQQFKDDDSFDVGIPAFDRMEYQEKLAQILIVGKGLLDENVPIIELNATNEATVAALYEVVKAGIEIEIDLVNDGYQSDFSWRRLALAAVVENCGSCDNTGEPFGWPEDEASTSLQDWRSVVEVLSEAILWDADYLSESLVLDTPSEVGTEIQDLMTMPGDYYGYIPPNPRLDEVPGILQKLERLFRDRPQ